MALRELNQNSTIRKKDKASQNNSQQLSGPLGVLKLKLGGCGGGEYQAGGKESEGAPTSV